MMNLLEAAKAANDIKKVTPAICSMIEDYIKNIENEIPAIDIAGWDDEEEA